MKILKKQWRRQSSSTISCTLKASRVRGERAANLIMGDVFGKPAIVTDNYCIRLRTAGDCGGFKGPEKVEMAFMEADSAGGGQ